MRVMILADANSPHTIKWVKGLLRKGLTICVWSISKPDEGIYEHHPNLLIFYSNIIQRREGFGAKAKYLTLLSKLKSAIKEFKPTILHAHFASSYGLLGALTGFNPYVISVWGSDVYVFPYRNKIYRKILQYNFRKADKILSTSHVMAEEISKFTGKAIEVTPFGIDLDLFKKKDVAENDVFTVGTVKTLENRYGINYLIEAFKIFKDKYPQHPLKLLIVGGGSLEFELKAMVKNLGMEDSCEFTGAVPYASVPAYHNLLDICLCLSNSESFGVSAIEASASEVPVIATNVGGLPEVIEDGVTGIIVPKADARSAAEGIEMLYLNPSMRIEMGKSGRERVKQLYDWENNLQQMVEIYRKMVKSYDV